MHYEPFDIVVLRPKFGGRVLTILEVASAQGGTRRSYSGVRLDKAPFTRRYRLDDEHILAKIGTLDPAALKIKFELPPVATPAEWQAGQLYAQFMAEHAPAELDRKRWQLLAGLKPGNCVPIVHFTSRRIKVEHHRFQTVLAGQQKFHFLATNTNGTTYKWMIDSIWLENEQPASRPFRADPKQLACEAYPESELVEDDQADSTA